VASPEWIYNDYGNVFAAAKKKWMQALFAVVAVAVAGCGKSSWSDSSQSEIVLKRS